MLDERAIHQRNSFLGPATLDDIDGLQDMCARNVVGAALLRGDGKTLVGRGDRGLQIARVKEETCRGQQRRYQGKRMKAASRVGHGSLDRPHRQSYSATVMVAQ